MKKLTEKRHIRTMMLLCVAAYFVSYITRINYAAVILEIIKTEGITKSMASLITTAALITYGIGQLISGFLGDKIKPKRLLFLGLLATSAMNFLFPASGSFPAMLAVWAVNGFAQAMMWPPLVKIMVDMFSRDDYRKACVRVSNGSSLGTIAVYLLAPFCIVTSGWRTVFWISAILGAVMAVVWLVVCEKMERHTTETPEDIAEAKPRDNTAPASGGNFAVIILIMAAIVLQGALKDGVTTWMPPYISETYNLSSFVSILTGVVLPVFTILCYQTALWLSQNVIKNELTCAACIFSVGFAAAAALFFAFSYNPALSVALSALLTGSMHGVNLMLIGMVPPYLERYGRVAFMSGALNFCTYIGSAASTYGIAVVSEKAGWQTTILCWAIIAFLGTAVCFIGKGGWEAFRRSNAKGL